ncbi:pyridoxal phosphate-dependent aminotransferase [Thermodesulfobacteriota bacterium]
MSREVSLAERMSQIKPSATLAITAKAKAMRADGINVIGFGAGEPDFDTPEHIKEAAVQALREGFTKYTAVSGIDELKSAICDKFSRDNGIDYELSQVVVSCGAKHSLYNLFQVVIGEGDEVIIPAPYWVSYVPQVLLAGGRPVILETTEENAFRVDPDALREAITPRTRALVFNSPSNPTGCAYSRADTERIAEIAAEASILVVADEVYEKIVYDGFSHTSIASLGSDIKDLTITVNAVSKTYSMTGWRIGYLAGSGEITAAINRIQGQSTSNPTSIAQKATIAALTGPQDQVVEMVKTFAGRRDRMLELLASIEGVTCIRPAGSFYAFPRFSSWYGKRHGSREINGSMDLADFLMDEAKVAVVPGSAFGADDYIRLSYATSMENIEEGLERTIKAMALLE